MKNYDLKLANDYINGEDITGYTLEELENDKDFMMLVIRMTHDKKLYSFCSDKVKKNYEFVRFIIKEFSYDLDFISNVADYFLENQEDELEKLELEIIMLDYIDDKQSDMYMKYLIPAAATYMCKRVDIEAYNLEHKNDKSAPKIGTGFIVIYDEYFGHEEILNFYAKRLINDIIDDNNINLEKIIHNSFKIPGALEKYGIKNFIINFISFYDDMLADYITSHQELMSDLEIEIKKIIKRYEDYEKKLELEKYYSIIDQVNNYMKDRVYESILDTSFCLCYVAKQLGIFDTFFKKYFLDKYFNEEDATKLLNSIDEETLQSILQRSFTDKANLDTIREIFLKTLSINDIKELNDLADSYIENEGNKGLVINISDSKTVNKELLNVDNKTLDKDYNNINEIKKLNQDNVPLSLRDTGLVLSYGLGDTFIPAGVFKISGFVDKDKNIITSIGSDITDMFVEFTEINSKNVNSIDNKKDGSKIYIPLDKCIKLFKEYENNNSEELCKFMSENFANLDLLALFEKFAEEYMKDMQEGVPFESFNFRGESFDEMQAKFVNKDLNRGTNFTLLPFNFGKRKKLIKTLTKEDNEKEKNEYSLENYTMYEKPEKVRTR